LIKKAEWQESQRISEYNNSNNSFAGAVFEEDIYAVANSLVYSNGRQM
jgi:hypothetical protein